MTFFFHTGINIIQEQLLAFPQLFYMIIYLSILSDVLLSLRKKKVGENQRSYETISFLIHQGRTLLFSSTALQGSLQRFWKKKKKKFFFCRPQGFLRNFSHLSVELFGGGKSREEQNKRICRVNGLQISLNGFRSPLPFELCFSVNGDMKSHYCSLLYPIVKNALSKQ